MASTKIQNLPLKAPIGAMKIPTGGFGDYSITVSSIGDFIIDTFNLATKDYVDNLLVEKEDRIDTSGGFLTPVSQNSNVPDTTNDVIDEVAQALLDRIEYVKDNFSAAPSHNELTGRSATGAHPSTSISHKSGTVYTYLSNAESDINTINNVTIPTINQSLSLKQDQITTTGTLTGTPEETGVNSVSHTGINGALQGLLNRYLFNKNHSNLTNRSDANSHPASAISYDSGSVSSFLDNQKILNSKLIQVINSIADLIAHTPRFNGEVAYVKSYYASEGMGGGYFVYDSAQSSVNNGVTIFNGWLRDVSDRYLSTHDAGLKEDGSDATAKLQAIADALQDNFTFEIFDKHLVNKRIRFLGISNLKVVGSGEVSAKELRDTWTFENHYGVLFFQDCPYLTVSRNIKVTGAKKFWTSNADPTQAGDSPISLKNCPHSLIEHTDLSHSVAWGIVAENSPYTIAQFNKIDDIVRQSGINLVINGGQYCKALNNNISNVGLYGIEWETYDPSFGNICTGNAITDCFKGVAITGDDQLELTASDNTINYCYNAIDIFPLLNAVNVNAHDNSGVGCYIALSGSSTKNVTYQDNIFDYSINKAWLQSNASNFILKFGTDRTQIYTFTDSTITNGQTVYVKDVAYTVSSVATVSDNSFAPSVTQLKLITLSTPVAVDVPEYTFIKTPVAQSSSSGLFASLTNTKLKFIGNTLTGYGRGISHQTNYGSIATGREYYLGNKFIDCTTWLYHPTSVATGSVIKGSVIAGANAISINHRNTIQYLEGRIKSVTNPTAKTSGTSVLTIPFAIDEAAWRFKIKLSLVAATTTGSIIVRIDGVDSYTITQADFAAASTKIFEVSGWASISQGNHTLSVVDTVGDLVFSSYQVDIYLS